MAGEFERLLGRPVPLVVLAGLHHHMMLEAPARTAALLDWLPETRAAG